jgi:hypothetical protein
MLLEMPYEVTICLVTVDRHMLAAISGQYILARGMDHGELVSRCHDIDLTAYSKAAQKKTFSFHLL